MVRVWSWLLAFLRLLVRRVAMEGDAPSFGRAQPPAVLPGPLVMARWSTHAWPGQFAAVTFPKPEQRPAGPRGKARALSQVRFLLLAEWSSVRSPEAARLETPSPLACSRCDRPGIPGFRRPCLVFGVSSVELGIPLKLSDLRPCWAVPLVLTALTRCPRGRAGLQRPGVTTPSRPS